MLSTCLFECMCICVMLKVCTTYLPDASVCVCVRARVCVSGLFSGWARAAAVATSHHHHKASPARHGHVDRGVRAVCHLWRGAGTLSDPRRPPVRLSERLPAAADAALAGRRRW